MTSWRMAALLLALNTLVFLSGMAVGGSSVGADRPSWLPPVWFRAGAPLVIAAGLWLGYRWAWWLALMMCSVFLLWTGLASLVLGFGGYFVGEGAAFRTLHLSMLLATCLAVFVLLLSRAARSMGRLPSRSSGPA